MKTETEPRELKSDFRNFPARQTRLFVFAGYDSTSSTIYYIFHLLATNPRVLHLRVEHDKVRQKSQSPVLTATNKSRCGQASGAPDIYADAHIA